MASRSTYSLASEDTKEARRGKHQQEISDNLTGHIKNFWAAPAEGLPTMPVPGKPDKPRKVTLKGNPDHSFHRGKATELGCSVAASVQAGPNDTKSEKSAKKRMAPAANMAVIATLESQVQNKRVFDMMLTRTVPEVKPDGGTNMFRSMELEDNVTQCARTQKAEQEQEALRTDPLLFDWDGVSTVVRRGAASLHHVFMTALSISIRSWQ
jgi:hypothetical protein